MCQGDFVVLQVPFGSAKTAEIREDKHSAQQLFIGASGFVGISYFPSYLMVFQPSSALRFGVTRRLRWIDQALGDSKV